MVSRTLTTSAVVIFVALAAIQQVTCNQAERTEISLFGDSTHNLDVGERVTGDSQLATKIIQHDRKRFRWVTLDYSFPENTVNDKGIFITNVVVLNLDSNDDGGYASIKKGGPGSNHVKVRLTSRWNKAVNFKITVYGFPKGSNA